MAGVLITVREGFQRLLENLFHEPLAMTPNRPTDLYVSNVIRRTLAHLIGRASNGPVELAANMDGRLKVESAVVLGTLLDAWEGTADDDYAAAHQFPAETTGIMVAALTHGLVVKFSTDGTTYSDEATVNAGESASFALAVNYVDVKNASGGNDAAYRIWAEHA